MMLLRTTRVVESEANARSQDLSSATSCAKGGKHGGNIGHDVRAAVRGRLDRGAGARLGHIAVPACAAKALSSLLPGQPDLGEEQ
jgi:hypothetical protein